MIDQSIVGYWRNDEPVETCIGSNNQYYTHPAFTFGTDELRGFWINKFEMSSSNPNINYRGGGLTTDLTLRSIPNVTSWRYNNISNYFTVIQNMQISNNEYGLSTSKALVDSHMITSYEWGAVAILSHSIYGRCDGDVCEAIYSNSFVEYDALMNDEYIFRTGCGGYSEPLFYYDEYGNSTDLNLTANINCEEYNTELGMLTSTTGNIYGVYDMAGASYEDTMGNMSCNADQTDLNYTCPSTGNTFKLFTSDSGFEHTWYDTNEKYLVTYAYDGYSGDNIFRTRLGDIVGGFSIMYYYDYFPYSYYPWLARGGYLDSASNIFDGGASTGGPDDYTSTRATLVSLN